MRDPYTVLGVESDASKDEIKTAFRRLAMLVHPDQNPDDFGAQERFAEINAAYQLLGDPHRRSLFDQGLIDARGKRRAGAHGATVKNPFAGFTMNTKKVDPNGESAEDIARRIFGDAYEGMVRPEPAPANSPKAKAEPRPEQRERRETIDDSPRIDDVPIDGAPVSAEQESRQRRSLLDLALKPLIDLFAWPSAPVQPGESDIVAELSLSLDDVLSRKSTDVTLDDGRKVAVSLPRGLTDGQHLRIVAEGSERADGSRSDVIVLIRFAAHPTLRPEGHDLHLELPLGIEEAVFGTQKTVEGLDGPADVEIPAWSGSDRTIRLAGRGLPRPEGGRGDLIVHLRVLLSREPDQKLIDMLQLRRGEWFV
jgi:DnaJ-class molecular chaperone